MANPCSLQMLVSRPVRARRQSTREWSAGIRARSRAPQSSCCLPARASPLTIPAYPRCCTSLPLLLPTPTITPNPFPPSPSTSPSLSSTSSLAAAPSPALPCPSSLTATLRTSAALSSLFPPILQSHFAFPASSRLALQIDLERVRGVDDSWMHALLPQQLNVKRLNVRNHCLSDDGLSAIALAQQLEQLLLGVCDNVTDAGMRSLSSSLPSLTTLELTGCSGVTHEGLEALSELRSLRHLDISMCRNIGGGLSHIASLPCLRTLNVGWCCTVCDTDIDALADGNCKYMLKELNIASTSITLDCIDSLSSLTNLEALSVQQSKLDDQGGHWLEQLTKLTNLKSLNLRGLVVRNSGMRALGESLLNLQELNLGFSLVGDSGISTLHNMKGLRVLDLESCKITNASSSVLAELTNMQVLNLSDSLMGGSNWSALYFLRYMPCLRWLDVSFAGLFNRHLEPLREQSMTSLEHLACDSRLVGNDALHNILGHGNTLKHLNLYGCRVSDHGAAMIGRMKSLKSLEMCGGLLTDNGLRSLCNLHNLEHLNLQQNYVSDASIPLLVANMPCLQSLNLANTRVSGMVLHELSKLPWLRTLTVNGCRISPVFVQRFQQQAPHVQTLSTER